MKVVKVEQVLQQAVYAKEMADCWFRRAIYESNPAYNEKAKQKLEEAEACCLKVIKSPAAVNYEYNKASDMLDEIRGL